MPVPKRPTSLFMSYAAVSTDKRKIISSVRWDLCSNRFFAQRGRAQKRNDLVLSFSTRWDSHPDEDVKLARSFNLLLRESFFQPSLLLIPIGCVPICFRIQLIRYFTVGTRASTTRPEGHRRYAVFTLFLNRETSSLLATETSFPRH